MDIDLIIEPDLSPAQLVELAQAAERYGIRGLWTSNYFAHWDPFISLVELSHHTDKLLLGALAVSPFEMHPLKIANALLSLNEISGGRGMVAIGAGEGNLEAMALTKPQKVVGAVRESIEIVRMAGRGELAPGYQGEHFQVNLPATYDWLEANPPLVYGTAYKGMMMRMEARVSDGVFVGCTPPEIAEPAMVDVNTGLARRNEPTTDFRVNTFWGWHIKADRAEGYRESRRELPWRARKLDPELLALYLDEDEVRTVRDNYENYVAAYFDRSGHVKGVQEEISNRLCDGLTSTGGLEDLDHEIKRFKLFEAAGLTEIALRLHDDPMDALKIIGERVVPALR